MELALSFFHSVYPKWVNSNVSRTLSLSSRELPGELHHSIHGWWLWSCVVRGEVNSILWFVSRWMKCDDGFFFFIKFLSIAEWDYYNVSVFSFVCFHHTWYEFLYASCYMLIQINVKQWLCVGDWTMEGKYELTSVIITEDIAYHTTEEPERRRKWTFATS